MITLHQFEISPFCDKIRRTLNVKRVPFAIREVPVWRAFGVRRINPAGKLPCLEHDGRFLADSTDIALHLEQAFPEPALLPRDPRDRALCHFFEDWADESLYFYEMRLRFTFPNNVQRFVPSLVHADPAWLRPLLSRFVPGAMRRATRSQGVGRKPDGQILDDVERHVRSLRDWLGDRDWLVGADLSLADLSVFTQLFCIRATDEGGEIVAGHAAVAAWMDRVDEASRPPGDP